jgi:carnitine O-acetyltransferase
MVPELSIALRFAETRLADLIQQNEFQTLEFMGYGKNFMTSMGFSPDAFVQMAFQAAYYGLYGRIECVYEPAMTKAYYHGRTEAIRPVTDESVEFVRTFWGEKPANNKVEALRKACEKHVQITKSCAKAQGHDRHLYALYCIWQRSLDEDYENSTDIDSVDRSASPGANSDNPSLVNSPSRRSVVSDDGSLSTSGQGHQVQHNMPSLFADSGWDKLNTTILSTSNCGNPSLRQFGFGPTSGEGFGIGYIVKDGSISICASSKHRQTARFIESLEAYFLEIRKLLRQIKRRGTSADKTMSRAREAEDQRPKSTRVKSRGRNILADQVKGIITPQTESIQESDDEGLGGCRTTLPLIYPSYSLFPPFLQHPDQGALWASSKKAITKETVGDITGNSSNGTAFNYGLATPSSSPPKTIRGAIINSPPLPPRVLSRKGQAKLPRRRQPHFSLL